VYGAIVGGEPTSSTKRVSDSVHGDVVVDRLVFLEPGYQRVAVVSPEWLDQLGFQLLVTW
jgi:hypothetical protein